MPSPCKMARPHKLQLAVDDQRLPGIAINWIIKKKKEKSLSKTTAKPRSLYMARVPKATHKATPAAIEILDDDESIMSEEDTNDKHEHESVDYDNEHENTNYNKEDENVDYNDLADESENVDEDDEDESVDKDDEHESNNEDHEESIDDNDSEGDDDENVNGYGGKNIDVASEKEVDEDINVNLDRENGDRNLEEDYNENYDEDGAEYIDNQGDENISEDVNKNTDIDNKMDVAKEHGEEIGVDFPNFQHRIPSSQTSTQPTRNTTASTTQAQYPPAGPPDTMQNRGTALQEENRLSLKLDPSASIEFQTDTVISQKRN
ncbi:hypothetical protein RUND412_004971 [Rhizina undulata]